MGNANINRNVTVVRRAAEAMGATVIRIHNGRKHHTVHIKTAEGIVVLMRVSAGYVDPYKQKGWVRQIINRAPGRRAMLQQRR
jgi:hypothetical protein